MFRRHHSEDPLAGRIDDLMAAVFIDNNRERLEKLTEHVASHVVDTSPQNVAASRRTSAVDVQHAPFRYLWERAEGEEITMEGWSLGWMDDSGPVSRIVSFDGLVPERSP
jgi:hypothetical protein